MMYCSYCGKPLEDDAAFCYACGKKVAVPDTKAFTVLQEQLRNLLHKLPEPDQRILKMRFGLDDGYSYTLDELCESLDVTVDDIRKAEANALGLLKEVTGIK